MANQNQSLLTINSKVSVILESYFSPSATLPTEPNVPLGSVYCFLSHVDPWEGDIVPAPTEDMYSMKQAMRNMFVSKQVTSSSISPVIQRIDWTANTIYTYYSDLIDMFAVDSNGYLINNFYAKNSYDQVFKCLWNNNGAPSTIEPYFQPGSYNTDNIYQGIDGYKWKYIYTIDTGSKVKFMDSSWIPVPVGTNNPNSIQTAAGAGSIDVINIINGGSGYEPSISTVNVAVIGDGTGATAEISGVSANGSILDIIVLTQGTNYTYANVVITSANGSGAIVIAPTSPLGGHGFDPISELGCHNIMFTCEFDGNEEVDGIVYLPDTIEYYQMGLVISPTSLDTFPYPANAAIYKTTTDVVVAGGFGQYVSDERVYQGASLETATFVGTVLYFDTASDVVNLINTVGTPIINAQLFGNTSGTSRTLLSYNPPKYVATSGYLIYLENLTGIQRSPDGIEQFRIVLGH